MAPVALVALLAPEGGIAGQALEVLLRLTASLKSWLNHPHPVLLQGEGVVGGVRPERKLHPDTGPSLQDDKAAGRQALRPFHQPLPPENPRQVSLCGSLLPQPQDPVLRRHCFYIMHICRDHDNFSQKLCCHKLKKSVTYDHILCFTQSGHIPERRWTEVSRSFTRMDFAPVSSWQGV